MKLITPRNKILYEPTLLELKAKSWALTSLVFIFGPSNSFRDFLALGPIRALMYNNKIMG